MDTDIKLLRAYTQLCVDANRALLAADVVIFEDWVMDTLWHLGSLARELDVYIDA